MPGDDTIPTTKYQGFTVTGSDSHRNQQSQRKALFLPPPPPPPPPPPYSVAIKGPEPVDAPYHRPPAYSTLFLSAPSLDGAAELNAGNSMQY